MACELYCCLLPRCKALRTCRSGFRLKQKHNGLAAFAKRSYRYCRMTSSRLKPEIACVVKFSTLCNRFYIHVYNVKLKNAVSATRMQRVIYKMLSCDQLHICCYGWYFYSVYFLLRHFSHLSHNSQDCRVGDKFSDSDLCKISDSLTLLSLDTWVKALV